MSLSLNRIFASTTILIHNNFDCTLVLPFWYIRQIIIAFIWKKRSKSKYEKLRLYQSTYNWSTITSANITDLTFLMRFYNPRQNKEWKQRLHSQHFLIKKTQHFSSLNLHIPCFTFLYDFVESCSNIRHSFCHLLPSQNIEARRIFSLGWVFLFKQLFKEMKKLLKSSPPWITLSKLFLWVLFL